MNQLTNVSAPSGSDIYVDIGGWHLFLRDMKVHTGVALALQAKIASGKIDEPVVVDVLKKVPVKARPPSQPAAAVFSSHFPSYFPSCHPAGRPLGESFAVLSAPLLDSVSHHSWAPAGRLCPCMMSCPPAASRTSPSLHRRKPVRVFPLPSDCEDSRRQLPTLLLR